MSSPAKILHLEDDPLDAELIERRLKQDGVKCEIQRVDSEAGLLKALKLGAVDLVLADYSLPGCDGLEALRLAKELRPEIPLLIVSGVLGEEAAVESLKNGATDYILKDRLSRLAPAVRRALDEAAVRRDRKMLVDQLTRAQKLEIFGELAGGVAHDYNNILTIIMANSGLLLAELVEGTRPHKHALQIEYACDHAASLTRQLLIFSRSSVRSTAVLDLTEIVKKAESMLRRLIPENIELFVSPGTRPLCIRADRGDIEQVLINLILNARDSIVGHGQIRVESGRARKAGHDFVFLNVEDNGCGMSPEVKAHIFEPFFTTKPEGSGTGLGLATCHRLIQMLGGRISVASKQGHGTRFRVVLPCLDNEEAQQHVHPNTSKTLPGCEKILLAEDNHMLRDMVATQLEELGYQVLQAANGIEGLEIFAEHRASPPDLVITDLVLPLLSGRELARLLQKSSPSLKILYTSGHTDQTIASLGLSSALGDILSKPFTLSQLSSRIREILPVKK